MIPNGFTTKDTKDKVKALDILQERDGRAKMRGGVVPELLHERVPIERSLYDAPLHAASAPVHETDFTQPGGRRRVQVLLDDRRNVAGCERVKIDFGVDGNVMQWL